MYKVIKANSISELQNTVEEYLEKGYTLCGGVSTMCDYHNIKTYYQAVSK